MPQRHLATPGGNADMAAMAQAMQHEMEMETPETVEEYMAHEKEHADAFASQIRKGGAALHISQTIEEDEEAERQLEENLWKYYRLLHPKGKFKPRWDSFVQILVVYNCTIIPMSLAFGGVSDTTLTIVDYLVDAAFLLDMLVSMSSVYYNKHFELVIERRTRA